MKQFGGQAARNSLVKVVLVFMLELHTDIYLQRIYKIHEPQFEKEYFCMPAQQYLTLVQAVERMS